MTSDALFTEVVDFPTGFAQPFTVSVDGNTLGTFGPGQSVNFMNLLGTGAVSFTVTGIKPLVDPRNAVAFPLKLDFSTETADFTMYAIIPPDGDADIDVDLDDFSLFQACITGPAMGPPSAECELFDFDDDIDIDQSDFGIFQRCLTGSDVIADPSCME